MSWSVLNLWSLFGHPQDTPECRLLQELAMDRLLEDLKEATTGPRPGSDAWKRRVDEEIATRLEADMAVFEERWGTV